MESCFLISSALLEGLLWAGKTVISDISTGRRISSPQINLN